MTSNRTQYSDAILLSLPPNRAAEAVRDRLNRAKLANDEIADWIKDRLSIEERYAEELSKLSEKPMQFANQDSLGEFATVWETIVRGAANTAKSSMHAARRGHAEIEMPIRNFSEKSRQWTEVRTLYEGLSTLAKALMDAEENHAKSRAKHSSDAKTEQAQIRLAETQSQWENQAPFVFSQFESADNGRFLLLKEALSMLQTLEVDKSKSISQKSEAILDKLLNFDPQSELSEFADKAAKGEIQPLKSYHRHTFSGGNAASSISAAVHKPKRMASGVSMNKPQPPEKSSSSSGFRNPLGRSNTGDSGPSTSSGAKIRSRVGSIFRKNKPKDRNNEQTITLSPTPSSGSSFSGTNSSRDFPSNGARDRGPASHGLNGRSGTLPLPHGNNRSSSSSGLHVQGRPLTHAATSPISSSANTNGKSGGRLVDQARNSDPAFDISGSSSSLPGGNSPAVDRSSKPRPPPSRKTQPFDEYPSHRDRILTVDEEVEDNLPLRMSIRKDAVPEQNIDADMALTNVASTLRATPTTSGRRSRGRRDIHSRLFSEMGPSEFEHEAGIPEDPADSSALPQRFQNQLQSLGSVPPTILPVVPNTFASGGPMSPLAPASTGNSLTTPMFPSAGTQSITSASSGGTPQAISRHSELPHDNGVVASIVETHFVNLKDGRVLSNKLSGEAILGYHGAASDQVSVEIAPLNGATGPNDVIVNPNVLRESGPNVYALDVAMCRDIGALAASYNVAVPLDYTPIVFSPIWRIEESQSSLMLTYHLTQECQVPQLVLNEVVIIVPVEGGHAVSAQSKPAASFNREKQRIVWRLPEPLVVKRGEEGRFLCRFSTNGPTREAASGIDIRFSSIGGVLDDAVSFKYYTSAGQQWARVASVKSVVGRYITHSEQNVQSK